MVSILHKLKKMISAYVEYPYITYGVQKRNNKKTIHLYLRHVISVCMMVAGLVPTSQPHEFLQIERQNHHMKANYFNNSER